MTEKITFRPKKWFEEEINKFMRIHHINSKTEAIHKVLEKYLELTRPKKIDIDFVKGTKVKCLSRNEYFDLLELPCLKDVNVLCTNEECWKRVHDRMEKTKQPKPQPTFTGHETVIFRTPKQ